MVLLRNIYIICLFEVFKFIMELFKYNDNSRNKVIYCFIFYLNKRYL